MSLNAALSNALSGLSAAQRGLSVISNNVANVNTEGYSRKIVHQAAVVLGGEGAGVQAQEPSRVVDRFLRGELRNQRAELGRAAALSDYQERIQGSILGAPGDTSRGLSNRLRELSSAAETLANAPEQAALGAAFVGAVDDLLGQIRGDARQVQALRGDADQAIGDIVRAINTDLTELQAVNLEIGRSGETAALADRRDTLLGSLASSIEISIHGDDDGTVSVYTRGGAALLDGRPSLVHYRPATEVAAGTSFAPIRIYRPAEVDPRTGEPLAGAAGRVLVSGGVRAEPTPELLADAVADDLQLVVSPFRTGRLQGLIEARDRVLPELADQIAELASGTRYLLNRAHNQGATTPPPGQLSGTRTDFSSFSGSGTAYLAVVDRLGGGTVSVIAVDLGATDPAAMVAQIDADLGALGDASFAADGSLRITLTDPGQGLMTADGDGSITAIDTSGQPRDYGLAHYLGLNDLVVRTGSRPDSVALRSDIAADVSRLSRVAMAVDPGPPATAVVGGAGDTRPAKALAAALQAETLTVGRGGLAGRPVSLSGYAADITALAAVDAAAATSRSDGAAALVEDLESRSAEISGVNLDQELAQLLVYQQAYSVSARIIAITDQLFDDLLAIKR